MFEPALLLDEVEVSTARHEAGPHTDHDVIVHGVQLLQHSDRIGPSLWVQVHRPHFCISEPINNQIVDRQMSLTISFRNSHQFSLCAVALLGLDVSIRTLRKHGNIARKEAVPAINCTVISSDDKEADPLSNLRLECVLVIKSERDRRLRRVVPDQPIALVGNKERHADRLATGSIVIVRTLNHMASAIKKSFLILSQPIIVLVLGSSKARTDREERRGGRAPVIFKIMCAVFVVQDSHLPAIKTEKRYAARRRDVEADIP